MAITKSSGSLFPLISSMKNQNKNETVVEPKLKRTVGQRQDVRTGDGLTTIMSKIWGLLKKQEDFGKMSMKEMANQTKFRKESKDLMKKNNQVILKSLNALNKDSTKILSKILKLEDKSLKEQQTAIEQQKTSDELKNNFSEENKKESDDAAAKRHKEIIKLLNKMAGKEDGEAKKEKSSFLQKLLEGMGKQFASLLEKAVGGIIGKTLSQFLVRTLPGLMASAVSSSISLALANPLTAIAAALAGLTIFMGKRSMDNAELLTELAKKGDIEGMRAPAEQASMEMASSGFGMEGAANLNAPTPDELIRDELKRAKTPAADAALKRLDEQKTNPNKKNTQQFPNTFSLPVQKAQLSSVQGHRDVKGGSSEHQGVDLAVPENTQVLAIGSGTIKSAGLKGGYGNTVEIEHDDGTSSLYAHLSKITKGLTVNTRVGAGTEIGRSGGVPGTPGAGHSTGAHLHLEVKDKNGKALNVQSMIPELAGAKKGSLVARGESSATAVAAASGESESADSVQGKLADQVASAENEPKMLGKMISGFIKLAKAEFESAEGLFTKEGTSLGPATALNDAIIETNKLKDAQAAKVDKKDASVMVGSISNNNVVNGGNSGGSSGQILTARSNDSTTRRMQQGIAVLT